MDRKVICAVLILSFWFIDAKVIDTLNELGDASEFRAYGPPVRQCPKCDSSVFSYCSDKLFHDSCCCSNPYDLPYQCQFADCSFLHSNTCREHALITQCCCTNYLFKKK